jgi:hypothetical protein
VLLVVGTEAAIIWTAPFHGGVVYLWHFRRLYEYLAATTVVINIISDEDALWAMLRATFKKVDVAILEDGFGLHFSIARGANRNGDIVEEIRARFGHELYGSLRRIYPLLLIFPMVIAPPTAIARDIRAQRANPRRWPD